MNNFSENNILNSISTLYDKQEKLFKSPEVLNEVTASLSCISEFFDTDTKTAAMLGVLICSQKVEKK